METIIGLLFILLPVIFKLVGKRLEQSGQTEKAEKLKKAADKMLGNDEDVVDQSPFLDWLQEESADESGQPVGESVKPVAAVTPVPAEPQMCFFEETTPAAKKKLTPAKKSVKSSVKNHMLEEETVQKKREKIDPKKLVIYSEIMKPKF